MSDAARGYREAFTLRGGRVAEVRAIRPDDRDRLQAAFHALEPESVYLRYFSFKQALTEADLDRLCEPDFHERVVLVVTLPGDAGEEIIVGAGGYVMLPGAVGIRAAEVAFAVEEDVQGQGISGKLLAVLADLARIDGIERFDAEVLSRNLPMLRVFERSGLPTTVSPEEDGVVHVQMALAPIAPTAP
jgi:RimJ/RimL family protein N-acetyltransferase